MIAVTGTEVKTCSKCRSVKPLHDFGKYKHGRDGKKPHCKACGVAYTKDWGLRNPGKKKAVSSNHWLSNRKRLRAYRKSWYLANRDKVRKLWAAEYQRNGAAYRERSRAWRAENPDKFAAQMAKRRAAELRAIPAWADFDAIIDAYAARDAACELFEIEVQADHIIPLQSDLVCGLHCAANLQLLTAAANRSKSNQYWPDMP